MIRANHSVAPGPRVGAISPPPWGAGRGRSGSQATRGAWFLAVARRGEAGFAANVIGGATAL